MIAAQYLSALRKICTRLKDSHINWVVTGRLGMALQGVPVTVHDIDIQTDKDGAHEIERHFSECVILPVRYSPTEQIRSHLGMLEIDDIKVEIMGDIQKRVEEQTWEAPLKWSATGVGWKLKECRYLFCRWSMSIRHISNWAEPKRLRYCAIGCKKKEARQ